MRISDQQFEAWISEAIDRLPKGFLDKTNNVAFLFADQPTPEQLMKIQLRSGMTLYGLYEGYHQATRKNIGPVLPDRITLFKKSFEDARSEEEARERIYYTIKHEIAHHFGSDEPGARKAGR